MGRRASTLLMAGALGASVLLSAPARAEAPPPPPQPVLVTAKAGGKPGTAIVRWQPGTPVGDQPAASSHLVTAVPEGFDGPVGLPGCGYVDAPARSCTVAGLRPGAEYRFAVVAGDVSGESPATQSAAVRIPRWSVGGTVQAVLCSGSELEREPVRQVRPGQVILDCDAYGPQYGTPLVRSVDGIAWTRWSSAAATGTGVLHWPTAVPCTQGEPVAGCGQVVADYPVRIELRNPQPIGRSGKRFAFAEVGLYPVGAGPTGCESSCWVIPPRIAYA